jgi:hypothetical protein
MPTHTEETGDTDEAFGAGSASTIAGVVTVDVSCHRCAYNLRGLSRAGRCPECGAPIEVSLAGDALRFADPEWLAAMARGAAIGETFLRVLVGCGYIILLTWALSFFGVNGQVVRDVTVALIVAAGMVTLFVSAWRISVPHPLLLEKESWHAPRRLIRYAIIGGICVGGAGATLYAARTGGLWFGSLLLGAPFGLLSMVGAYGTGRYCGDLAGRAGNNFVVHRARIYLRGYAVCWITSVLAVVVTLPSVVAGVCLFVPAVAGLVAFGILLLSLPTQIASSLRQHREAAERTWAEAQDRKHTDTGRS